MRRVDPVFRRRSAETAEATSLRRRIAASAGKALRRSERTISHDAGALLLRASQLASAWSFRAAEVDQLREIIAALTGVALAANALERAEAPDGAF